MSDKIKITKEELEDIYDIQESPTDKPKDSKQKEESSANATFEEFTEYFDEKELKEE